MSEKKGAKPLRLTKEVFDGLALAFHIATHHTSGVGLTDDEQAQFDAADEWIKKNAPLYEKEDLPLMHEVTVRMETKLPGDAAAIASRISKAIGVEYDALNPWCSGYDAVFYISPDKIDAAKKALNNDKAVGAYDVADPRPTL